MTNPTLSKAVFDEWTGVLTLVGDDLTSSASDFVLSDLTLTGQGAASYSLTAASSIVGAPTSTSLAIQLSGHDLSQIASLFNQAGANALDGTAYAIQAAASWDTSAASAQTAPGQDRNGYVFDAATSRFVASARNETALDDLINAANSATSGAFEVDLAGNVALPSALAAIKLKAGVTLDIKSAFTQLGPSPKIGSVDQVQSEDQPPNGTVTGAVQAIVTDPADSNTLWIGSPGGGIWVTHDGGASWTPLTDNQASLSIASLSLDPTDTTNQTLIAGVGLTSNGTLGSLSTNQSFFLGDGGQRTGVLYSTDGGATWSALGGSTLAGHSIVGVAARGQTLLAAAFEPWALYSGDATDSASGGLFRSTDGGATFSQVGPASGLPTDPTSVLIGDPTSPTRLYAAITSPTDSSVTALYVSNDTGANWSEIFGATQSNSIIGPGGDETFIRAAANGSEIAVAVGDAVTNSLTGLFLSTDSGATWTQLPVTDSDFGNQALTNLQVALDPTQAGVVYVTGSGISSPPYTVAAYRVTTSGETALTGADGSTVHADSRAIAFDANGRLILGTDGGIYARSDPASTSGVWTGLNGANLSLGQPYAVAFDGNSDRLAVAAQDIGVSFESQPSGQAFTALSGGDGVNVGINDQTAGNLSVIYYSSQNLSLQRTVVDSNGNPYGANPTLPINLPTGVVNGSSFKSPFVLNNIDPTRIAIGADDVFITQDNLQNLASQSDDTLNLTDVGSTGTDAFAPVTAISYGTQDNTGALLVGGDETNALWLSTDPTPASGTLMAVTAYQGLAPTSLTFDLRTQDDFYVVDGANLYGTQDEGATMQTLTSNLSALGLLQPTSVDFIANNGVDALLVGGDSGAANSQSPIAVADSDSSGDLSNWRQFGTGLPNTLVGTMSYDAKSDTLAVGLYGRGGWALYDVTSNFSSATVLQFGLANNNSTPSASVLTGSRPLEKYGSGTLTITQAANYTGGSTINAGVMQIDAGASVVGTIAFNGPSTELGLGSDTGFNNTLSGLDVGAGSAKSDFVDIEGHAVTIASETGQGTNSGSVNLSDGTILHLNNIGATTWFARTGSDGAGGVDVFLSNTACYARGTHILTERGEIAIESLGVGDLVITASGQRRPVRWIGHRGLDISRHPDPAAVRPVRVATGAFGEGAPHRDLWLSPGHNVASEGALMPISCLINGRSVAQFERKHVEYWHVELDEQDVILAEGLAAESYLDTGNRTAFANGDAFVEAHPDFAPKHWADTCLPLVKEGPSVIATKTRILARLAYEGHCVNQDADAHIIVDGLRVEPTRQSETQLTFTLPPGGRKIVLCSNVFIPAHTVAESSDLRELGLCVGRVQIDYSALALDDDQACASGWHEAEYGGETLTRRWTAGATALPVGARTVIVDLVGAGYYWRSPEDSAASCLPEVRASAA